MKYKELKKILKNNGWEFFRQAKGSHEIWIKNDKMLSIPNHGSKELSNYFTKIAKDIKADKYGI